MENRKWRIFVICSMILLLGSGIIVGNRIGKNVNVDDGISNISGISISNKRGEQDVSIYNAQDKAVINNINKKDILVTYVDYYLGCNEEIKKNETIADTTIEEVKKSADESYSVIEEGQNYVIFSRTNKGNCPNHYLIKVENDKVNIYNVKSNNNIDKIRTLDVAVNVIREDFLEELKDGIYLDSTEELEEMIEDLES